MHVWKLNISAGFLTVWGLIWKRFQEVLLRRRGKEWRLSPQNSSFTRFMFAFPAGITRQHRQRLESHSYHICGSSCATSFWYIYTILVTNFEALTPSAKECVCVFQREANNALFNRLPFFTQPTCLTQLWSCASFFILHYFTSTKEEPPPEKKINKQNWNE